MCNQNANLLKLASLLICSLVLIPSNAFAKDKTCGQQNYSAATEPDFECPSPGEVMFIPDMPLRPSIGVPAGSVIRLKGTAQFKPIAYEAVLLDKLRVIHLGLRVIALRKLRYLDGQNSKSVFSLKEKYGKDTQDALIKLYQSKEDKLKNKILDMGRLIQSKDKEITRLTTWYRSPLLWFCTGATVMLGSLAIFFIAT